MAGAAGNLRVTSTPVRAAAPSPSAARGGWLQRKCACGSAGTEGECEECRKTALQRQAAGTGGPAAAPSIVHDVLRSPGRPLDATARRALEPRLGHDFSKVRIHADARAAASARAVGAAAYTVGPDIAFAEGQYQPATPRGQRLLAHELTHVVQQARGPLPAAPEGSLPVSDPADAAEREAERVSCSLDGPAGPPPIVERPPLSLARAPLDVDGISKDAANPGTVNLGPVLGIWAPVLISQLFVKYGPHASGQIAFAADFPTTFTLPKDTSKPVATLPKVDKVPPLSNIPVEAHFFPPARPAQGRALVIGGFHGDEQPGWQMVEALVAELSAPNGTLNLAFNTIVVPRLNAAAIADELAGVRMWRNRCNRQIVDLNRNFPTGNTPKDTDCANTVGAPIQPEVQAVMDLITKFKPDRILSTHAISTASSAGIFADPNQDPKAIELARGMASTLLHPSDRPFNRLGTGTKDFNPVYPLDQPGVVGAGTSLGAWGPTAIPGQTTPVITLEAPEFKALSTGPVTDPRTVAGYLRPLRAFLSADVTTAADRDILADIDAMTVADRVAFLTGRLPSKNDIYARIQFRIDTAIARLNDMKPPVNVAAASDLRLFSEKVGGKQSQADIDFEKFFLIGDTAKRWDTLPDQFFKGGDRKKGVDRAKWLATPSKDRLAIIIRFSSLPGTSRHHWNTEVDFNSVEVVDWQPASGTKKAGKFFALGQWLQANAPKVGFLQSYTPGRSGGYQEEPWHWSYAPISIGLRQRYNQEVNLQADVIDKIVDEFKQRAAAAGQTMPADFPQALQAINISDLVNNIGPGL
jgi:hypothetical protein